MTKKLKLSDDFFGTLRVMLNTPPQPRKAKRNKATKKRKAKR